jgi:hypothetical protein
VDNVVPVDDTLLPELVQVAVLPVSNSHFGEEHDLEGV